MAEPPPGVVRVPPEGRADLVEDGLEDGHGQACPRLTVRRGGERPADQVRQVRQRRVPVEDLNQEDVDDRERVQDAAPPAVAEGPALVQDRLAVEHPGDVVAKVVKNREHLMPHRGASDRGLGQATPSCRTVARCSSPDAAPPYASLNAIRTDTIFP